jgi:hypothetical protein
MRRQRIQNTITSNLLMRDGEMREEKKSRKKE